MERVTMRYELCGGRGGSGETNVVVSITEKGWFWHFASFTSIATEPYSNGRPRQNGRVALAMRAAEQRSTHMQHRTSEQFSFKMDIARHTFGISKWNIHHLHGDGNDDDEDCSRQSLGLWLLLVVGYSHRCLCFIRLTCATSSDGVARVITSVQCVMVTHSLRGIANYIRVNNFVVSLSCEMAISWSSTK